MITEDGREHIKRFVAGYETAIAQQIAIGIGDEPESTTDFVLQFESGRTDITSITMDPVTNEIYLKAPLPEDYEGEIREVGIFSNSIEASGGGFDETVVTTFDDETEDWIDVDEDEAEDFTETGSRISANSLLHDTLPGTTKTSSMGTVEFSFAEYSGSDNFVFAYSVGNTYTTDITFRFMTDESNYYDFSMTTITAGYHIVTRRKSTADVIGSPDWSQINEIRVLSSSSTSGPNDIAFDGIRVQPSSDMNLDSILVARTVLAEPYIREEGKQEDIEYRMEVNL